MLYPHHHGRVFLRGCLRLKALAGAKSAAVFRRKMFVTDVRQQCMMGEWMGVSSLHGIWRAIDGDI